jgi:hypothetical protein
MNKETSQLNDTVDQMNLTDIYRIIHAMVAQYTFFLLGHRTSSKIDILGHKASLSKHKKI